MHKLIKIDTPYTSQHQLCPLDSVEVGVRTVLDTLITIMDDTSHTLYRTVEEPSSFFRGD